MSLSTFFIINGIFFWVLCAIAVVVLMMYGYVYFTYFKWNREDRMREFIHDAMQQKEDEDEN